MTVLAGDSVRQRDTLWSSILADVDVRLPPERKGVSRLTGRTRVLLTSRGLWMLTAQRVAYRARHRPSRLTRLLSIIGRVVTIVACKSDLSARTAFEDGVVLPDEGYLVMGATTVGRGTVIGPRVAIGRNLSDWNLPTIGERVRIGSDCVIFGAVTIGSDVTILPGTVLSKSVPSGTVVSGNPARFVRRTDDVRRIFDARCDSRRLAALCRRYDS